MMSFTSGSDDKNLPPMQETGIRSWVGKIPWRRQWQPTPIFLPGEFHGQRSLVGYSAWVCKESGVTEQLTFSLLFFKVNDASSPAQNICSFLAGT